MTNKTCPDCKGELLPIKLFGRGWENPLTGVAADSELVYYAPTGAERSGFSGMYKPEGTVGAFLCHTCGRIFLYGNPK
jgi:hypothetical protein